MKKLTAITAALTIMGTTAMANPNNYIRTDDNGVMYEQDHGSSVRPNFNGNIISRDMVTQNELNEYMSRMDASVNSLQALSSATAAIQMDPSHQGFQIGVGMGFNGGEYEGAIGMGISMGDRTFGYMSVDTRGSVGASVNFRF